MATISFYQINSKTGAKTFNAVYDLTNEEAQQIDYNRFASAMANKIIRFRELSQQAKDNGYKLSFSESKPMYFEFNNGTSKVLCNEVQARQIGMFIKGKKGKNLPTKTQLKNAILIVLNVIEEYKVIEC